MPKSGTGGMCAALQGDSTWPGCHEYVSGNSDSCPALQGDGTWLDISSMTVGCVFLELECFVFYASFQFYL